MYDSDFEGANFRGADLSFAEFSRCNLRNTCLEKVIWNDESSLDGVDLTGAIGFNPRNVCGYQIILPNGEEIEFTEKLISP
ncbi:pentapeptide repeat-containing protein [Nostoc sp.]|uniref:pentapeptide repeat-containing protein n=1 Tax=Nostoc sp. TaxID=1180 RepID=UPI003FA5910F